MANKLKPGWRIKLSNYEKSLVVNADTEQRARELALEWALAKANNPDATIISCQRMLDDEFYVAEGEQWTPEKKG